MAPPKRPTKPKPAANPDFKRIKAKVGKRAPKAMNETDTSFKSASINVKKQAVAAAQEIHDNKTLITARGKTIQELTLQLQHPSSVARLSAAKGLKDLVVGKQTSPEVVLANLSVLIPTISKCCVDEDGEVRELGLVVLREMIQKLNLIAKSDASISLRPFLPLLIAFVSSALNSLDRRTRLDGAAALLILSNAVTSSVTPYVIDLLPAFVRLLSDRSIQNQGLAAAPESGAPAKGVGKKRKRSSQAQAKSAKGGQYLLFQSLVSLLKSATVSQKKASQVETVQSTQQLVKPDLIFASGGRSRNALFLEGRANPRRRLYQLSSLNDIPTLDKVASLSEGQALDSQWDDTNDKMLSPTLAVELLSKIRDALVESSQTGAAQDFSTYILLAKALRLFCEAYGKGLFGLHGSGDEWEKLRKVRVQMISLILDAFPLSGAGLTNEALEEANTDFCLILISMSSNLPLKNDKDDWVDPVLSYIQSSFEKLQEANDSGSNSSSRASMEVFGKLLFLKSADETFVLGAEARALMIETFCSVFFPANGVDSAIAQSTIGRQAALLARELFESFGYDLAQVEEDFGSSAVTIAEGLPYYLAAWNGDFPADSSSAILFLHNIVRRIDDLSHPLIIHLRTSLEPIIESQALEGQGKLSGSTIFERYGLPHLQRLMVGLVVMIGAPTAKTLAGLSKICARCYSSVDETRVTRDVSTLIIGSIHNVRKTMPMQSYLSFLVDSTGLMQVDEAALLGAGAKGKDNNKASRNWKKLADFDVGLYEVCHCLVDCGSAKVLPMLYPLLSTWLERTNSAMNNRDVLQLRAAFSVMAMFSIDLKSSSTYTTIFGLLSEDSEEKVIAALCRYAVYVVPPTQGTDEGAAADTSIRPLIALFQSEPDLFQKIFQHLTGKLGTMDGTAQCNGLNFLLAAVKSPQLNVTVRSLLGEMVSQAKEMEAAFVKGPLELQAGRILAELELRAETGR
jgi:hypothetical protein